MNFYDGNEEEVKEEEGDEIESDSDESRQINCIIFDDIGEQTK